MKFPLLISVFMILAATSFAQVAKSVVLDSVVIQAVKQGFDVNDFIEMVKSDTSFLRGFRNLRNSPHEVKGYMTVYGKKKKIVATRYRLALQQSDGRKRWIKIVEEKVTGDFYDRHDEPETYTAELFDDIFFYKDTLPVLPPSVSISSTTNTNNSGNINKLKKLVFNPGAEVDGVPLVGKRLAIFDEEMVPYYDYTISTTMFRDSISCYVFSCKEKDGAGDYPVLKNLKTYFDRKTFNIVYREYSYRYSGMLFDFDVTMQVTMGNENDMLIPVKILYSGFWDLPLRKQETVDFELDFNLDSQ